MAIGCGVARDVSHSCKEKRSEKVASEGRRTRRPRLGCSTTLMSLKKERRWLTGSTRGRHRDAVELLQGVCRPVLQKEGVHQVPARLALGGGDRQGKRERGEWRKERVARSPSYKAPKLYLLSSTMF